MLNYVMSAPSASQACEATVMPRARDIIACQILAQLLAAEKRSSTTISIFDIEAAVQDIVSLMERLASVPTGRLM